MDSKQYKLNLDTEIQYLKGVGPKRGSILKQFGIFTVSDLLKHYPRKYVDRTNIKLINQIKIGEKVVLLGKVESFSVKRLKKGSFFELTMLDKTGYIKCVWFHGVSWIMEKFSVGNQIAIFGKVEYYKGYRIIHPEFDILDDSEDIQNTGKIIPFYSTNNMLKQTGLDSRRIHKLIMQILYGINNISDHLSTAFLKQEALFSINKAIHEIHNPTNNDNLKSALYRLKFDEYFFQQLILALNKYKLSNLNGKPFNELGEYVKEIYKNLTFELTNSQIKVLREIRKDLSSNKPMNRIIQGDVGCGKTIVALLVSAIIVGDGSQVAIMAPTEILAEQHFSFNDYCSTLGIGCELLISNIRTKEKNNIYENIKSGKTQIIIGTHALIQENVEFNNLALVIFDEQHKFGVEQRKNLISKGLDVHILAMTATPIPRTLTLTVHGDMGISWIDEQPKNRLPIETKIVNSDDINTVYDFMKEEMDNGKFCFIVFPIIQESEKIDAKDAESAYKKLSKNIFSKYKVGFLHGKLKKEDKTNLMLDVNNGKIQCLVSTTVVEVGINNPNATVMMIENAERFGLTQLHQLRGRVGRGEYQSYCYLVKRKDGLISNQRLDIMESTLDGFMISDEDLKLRGPGDFFGTKQHGYISNKLFDLANDGSIIRHARRKAFEIIDTDPNLISYNSIKNKMHKDYKHMLEFINIG